MWHLDKVHGKVVISSNVAAKSEALIRACKTEGAYMKAEVKRGKGVKTVAKEAGPEKVKLLKVKAGMKYRGAREAWYAVLQQHDGKSVDSFLEATAKKPPSLPKSGKAEKPAGWLRFFERTGVASEA